ncbi:hypothetical protein CH063_02534 [Colletotrichum higginsianum]|uniref:tRNA (Adenine-N(1)-)-methyltransferase n=1 Tax=Colletotrichum higginsianum (strain IMI 349063) TaxID=759273 RepID=H1VLU1_COLHI|nr:tRNA (Adenine-N(1)-)-methyltransferase [Colletotrichum higginsianum IMI 349063]OBR03905.1 tRNA (Adenine-N(1)-)-methyltransferase [Colletotrichum higginsianum IMI 349063]CCF41194.1 hypothetical protein CH063_02534 [Colletotrichum higginsianum]
MTQLEHLPGELLASVAEWVKEICGLASLTKTSRRLNAVATPLLYREEVRRNNQSALLYCAGEGLLGSLELLRAAGQDLAARRISYSEPEATIREPFNTDRRSGASGRPRLPRGVGKTWEGAIHRAVLKGEAEVVRWLITNGVPVNQSSKNLCKCDNALGPDPNTPLRLALCHRQMEAAHILLANGATMRYIGAFPDTTAWQAAVGGHQPAAAMEFAFSVASKHSEVIHGHMGSFTDEKHHSENAIRDSCIKPMVELDDQSQSYSATAASHFWEVAQADTIAGIDNPLQQDGLADTDGAVQAGSAMAIDVPGPKLQCKGRPIAEDDILSAVTDLLDPIAAIEAYADSDKKEYVLGQKRRLKKIATRASHKKKKIAGHYV